MDFLIAPLLFEAKYDLGPELQPWAVQIFPLRYLKVLLAIRIHFPNNNHGWVPIGTEWTY